MSVRAWRAGAGRIELVRGDLTLEAADAIGNAANEALAGGGGVDGALHRAGGPEILAECRVIGGCPTGEAVVTTAGRLAAKRLIHTVGPVWRGGAHGEAGLLASCYRRTLELAEETGSVSLALPSVSTGVYGYPVRPAAGIALATVAEGLARARTLRFVRFVLFNDPTLAAYGEAALELERTGVLRPDGERP